MRGTFKGMLLYRHAPIYCRGERTRSMLNDNKVPWESFHHGRTLCWIFALGKTTTLVFRLSADRVYRELPTSSSSSSIAEQCYVYFLGSDTVINRGEKNAERSRETWDRFSILWHGNRNGAKGTTWFLQLWRSTGPDTINSVKLFLGHPWPKPTLTCESHSA